MNETAIRDYLAANLHVIEPDLELIRTEYQLRNPAGAGGRIDILARDRGKNLVVIEVKRADASARTALHELMKYVALLTSEMAVSASRIRCVLVSTEWRELKVPFSQLAHTSPFTLEGRVLELNENGTPTRTERFTPLTDSLSLNMPDRICWLTFVTADSRDRIADQLKELLPRVGVDRALMVSMNSKRPRSLPYPFSLALVIYPPSLERAQAMLAQRHFPIHLLEDDVQAHTPLEEAAQNALLSKVVCLDEVMDVHDSSLETFQAERDRWDVAQLIRIGSALLNSDLHPDADLLDMLAGSDGRNDVQLTRAVCVAHKAQLRELVHYAETLLSRYPGWWPAVASAIDRVKSDPEGILVLHAYCPDNFLLRLSLYLWEGRPGWLPSFDVVLAYNGTVERLRGSVSWDGATTPNVDGILPLEPDPWLLIHSDPKTVSAVIRAVGLEFPTHGTLNTTFLPPESRGASLEQLASTHPAEISELARRLGRVLNF